MQQPAADDNQIGVVTLGFLAHGSRDFADRDAQRGCTPHGFLQLVDRLPGLDPQRFLELPVQLPVRPPLDARNRVYQPQGGAGIFSVFRRPFDQRRAPRRGVHGAQNVASGHVIERRRIFHVGGGPHRTQRVVQYFGGHRTQQQAAEGTITMRRHHDQVRAFVMRVARDGLGRIADFRHPVHGQTRELLDKCVLEAELQVALELVHVHQHGSRKIAGGRLPEGRNHTH